MESALQTKFVSWNWDAWCVEFEGVVLKPGMRFTAKKWNFKVNMPEWIHVDVIEDKHGKLWLVDVDDGKLYGIQDLPLLCNGNE